MIKKEDLSDFPVGYRLAVSRPAMKSLINLKAFWGLDDEDLRLLLNKPSKIEFREWMRAASSNEDFMLPNDVLHRISAILKVFEELHIRFSGDRSKISNWLRSVHKAPVFEGRTPLACLSHSDMDVVLSVRNYTSAWRQGEDQ